MGLEDTKAAQDWLTQFECADREVARQMLRKLTLISLAQFEEGLQKAIESLLQKISRENIALFSITEQPSRFDTENTRRVQGSSADRVKHLLENLVRVHGDRIRANPTVDSMRADRIRNIVLVDDFVGSGERIAEYWKKEVSKSAKSWLSYGWVKIWIVSYAAMEAGIANLRRSIPKLRNESILTVLPQQGHSHRLTEPMIFIAQKYGKQLRKKMWLGYADGGGTIVFQHGCPNNAPAILWANGKRFKPLFPDRGVPAELHNCFGQPNLIASAENLWNYKQYQLALTLIDHIAHKKAAPEEWSLIVALAFASSRGMWDDNDLQVRLQIRADEMNALRRRAYAMSLIDKQSHKLTAFGQELLKRLRKSSNTKAKPTRRLPNLSDLYYPQSCEGVSKH